MPPEIVRFLCFKSHSAECPHDPVDSFSSWCVSSSCRRVRVFNRPTLPPPPWLWKLRLALSVIVFAFVMLYAITGERRCSSEDTNT